MLPTLFIIGNAALAAVFFLLVLMLKKFSRTDFGKSEECAAAEARAEAMQERLEAEKQLHQTAFDRERELTRAAFAQEKAQLVSQYEEKLRHQQELSAAERQSAAEQFAAEKRALLQTAEERKIQHEQTLAALEKEHQTRLAAMKEEFKNLSEKILEEKSGKLHNANKEQFETLLNPLKEKMVEFKNAVEASKNKGIELNSALVAQIKEMRSETVRIGNEAKELAKALKGGQKTQGDWGELILEEILERSGLQSGIHYEKQETLKDADGHTLQSDENKRMRPDVVVHYPDAKDVIIDSKVSLTAYADYMNAEDAAAKEEALTRHLRSVRAHVDELARKSYAAYLKKSGRDAVEFVVMFIPGEGPYHLAMIKEPTLWNEAFKQQVLMVSPANLMALLKIIHIAWTRDDQTKNQQKILETATQLLERLYQFYKEFDDIGQSIEKLHVHYDAAAKKLKPGVRTQSVVAAGEKLRQLGVKMNKPQALPLRLAGIEGSEEENP